jgi:hypothetical protein
MLLRNLDSVPRETLEPPRRWGSAPVRDRPPSCRRRFHATAIASRERSRLLLAVCGSQRDSRLAVSASSTVDHPLLPGASVGRSPRSSSRSCGVLSRLRPLADLKP